MRFEAFGKTICHCPADPPYVGNSISDSKSPELFSTGSWRRYNGCFFRLTNRTGCPLKDKCPKLVTNPLLSMVCIGWSLFAVFIGLIAQAKCESTAFPVIPKYLIECYMDEGLYHRTNRMPSTFSSFLDLLRKVEEGPTSKNMNARELSLALMQYLKLDGIQSLQSHMTQPSRNILPFAPYGGEYFKHRLSLVGLLPKIDQRYLAVFNETLTKKEMCDLHFMLSYSIDPYKRSDERCSPLYGESRMGIPDKRLDWHVTNYYKRYRRQINQGKMLDRRRRNGERDMKQDVEEIPVLARAHGKTHEEKDKFTVGTQELLSDGERYKDMRLKSLVQMGNFGPYGRRPFWGGTEQVNVEHGLVLGLPLSDCPVVNGVITAPFGSLTIGTVIAGIAAGLNPEEILPTRLSVDHSELESPSDRVKNIWATTLAGTIADIISSSAILNGESFQILKGGWNDSADPKWYLLSSGDFKHLPEVALRGSLDGLLLGLSAKEWTDKFSGFKLSQMLHMYYEFAWGEVGAQNREQLRSKLVPEEALRKQAYLMSLVLKKQKIQALTVLDYRPMVADAVSKVVQHISMMDNEKSYIGSFLGTKTDNSVDMIAVIDSSWGHENLIRIFRILRDAQVASSVGNNLTIICGKDGRVLMSSDNSADVAVLFTKQTLLESCNRGMDLALIFDKIDQMYRRNFYDEKTSNKMITASQVFALFPYEPLLQQNDYIVERSRTFRRDFPDVRLMVATTREADSFLPLVKDPKDVFSIVPPMIDREMKSVQAFADGVKSSYHRLSRPSCGSYFDDDTQGSEVQVTRDVLPGYIAYYKLQPQYFYTQHGLVIISIKSKNRKPLTVCHSREEERPMPPTARGDPGADYYPPNRTPDYHPNGDPDYRPNFPPEASPYERQTEQDDQVICKTITSETYKIEMNNPCEGSSFHDCQPLYISLMAPLQEKSSPDCQNCRLPFCTKFDMTLMGLTCYNSAVVKMVSPILFFLLVLRYVLV